MKLVSAIMPTRGRPAFARKAVDCFLAQTYPAKQMVIFDDTDEPSFDERTPFPRSIIYRRWQGDIPLNIASKRNHCCRISDGQIIMHFDSDDWSAPERMADQVARLEESGLSLTGYHSMLFFEQETGRVFKYHAHTKFYGIGTSLTYFRSWWERYHFPEEVKVGEDNEIVKRAAIEKQLISVDAGAMMIARIHAGNSSSKDVRGGSNYQPVGVEQLPEGFVNANREDAPMVNFSE